MPHVASQVVSGELFLETPSRRRAVGISKTSVQSQRPTSAFPAQRQKIGNADEMPRPSLHVSMPVNQQWDIGSIRHIQEPKSAAGTVTPRSPVDSIFELYTPAEAESPNSSVSPSFAAELEDTSTLVMTKRQTAVVDDCRKNSPVVLKKSSRVIDDPYVAPLSPSKTSLRITTESYVEQLTRTEFSTRAASAIENITAIEKDNRLLLERAIAAEEAAQLLREKNRSLQHRIDYCINLHRPKTPSDKGSRAASSGNIMSAFNEAYKTSLQRMPQTPPLLQAPQSAPTTPTPTGRRRPEPLKLSQPQLAPSPFPNQSSSPFAAIGIHNMPPATPQTYAPSKHLSSPLALSSPLISPGLPQDLAPSPFPTAATAIPANPHPQRRSRPPPIHTSRSYTKLSSISSPIPGSVNKHTVTYEGVPLSGKSAVPTISLSEARRRDKPLPPLGMSPSTIFGRVEIGGSEVFDCRQEEEEAKRRTGFKVLFKWGKKNQSQIF